MEEKEAVVVDTSFLSSLFKIRRLNLIFRTFNIKEIIITKAVLRELKESVFYDEFFELLKKGKIVVKEAKRTESSRDFGNGELESISLSNRINSVLLMDDRVAGKFARSKGIIVVDIPGFLLNCKKREIISHEEIRQIIRDLKEKDHYDFSIEAEDLLLKD